MVCIIDHLVSSLWVQSAPVDSSSRKRTSPQSFNCGDQFLIPFIFKTKLSLWLLEQILVGIMGVQADFFSFGQKIFPFLNLNPFPFEPKETKIREDIFSEMKEREECSSIFDVLERIHNVKFSMNAQTWLLTYYYADMLKGYLLFAIYSPRQAIVKSTPGLQV